MDFSQVKYITIPQGNVGKITINGEDVWTNNLIFESGAIASASGNNTSNERGIRTVGYVNVQPSRGYVASCEFLNSNRQSVFILEYGNSQQYLNLSSGWQDNGYVFTTSPNTYYVRIVLRIDDSTTISPSDLDYCHFDTEQISFV